MLKSSTAARNNAGGHPKCVTLASGSKVGMFSGCPEGTSAAGCNVGVSGGHPEGTTLVAGCNVGLSGGHPEGTIAAGCNVGVSHSRWEGTTLSTGYSIGMSGGRPEGTTLDWVYGVGTCNNSIVDFKGCDLPTYWDVLLDTAIVTVYTVNSYVYLHNVHLTNSLLQREFVGSVAAYFGVMVLVKVLT